MKRLALCSLVACAGCWNFDSLSSKLGADLASSDLAPLDLAPLDLAPLDLAPLPCPDSGFTCVDFESPLPSSWALTSGTGSNGIVEVTSAFVHGGANALHVSTPGTGTVLAEIQYTGLNPSNDAPLYVRYWLYVPTMGSTSPDTQYSIIQETDSSVIDAGTGADGQWALTAYTASIPMGDQEDIAPLTIDAWACVLLSVSQASASLTVGGATRQFPAPTAAPATVNIGIARGNSGVSTEAYVDDIVLSTMPLSCD